MNARLPMILGVAIVLGLLLSACGVNIVRGSGRIRSESRDASDFTAVNFSGFGELTIFQGDTEELTLKRMTICCPISRVRSAAAP